MLYDFQDLSHRPIARFGQVQYSQFGEDVTLWSWLETLGLLTPGGFFVDVGAHHPVRGSNTKLVRDILGWSGINIEPDPALFKEFTVLCPDCINLQMAVGDEPGAATLSVFNHPGVNTISNSQRDLQSSNSAFHVVETVQVEVRRLSDILAEHLPARSDYRLLTVDAEGLDLNVLKGADLERYRPKLIMVEDFELRLAKPDSAISGLLSAKDYELVSHCMVTSVYRDLR